MGGWTTQAMAILSNPMDQSHMLDTALEAPLFEFIGNIQSLVKHKFTDTKKDFWIPSSQLAQG